MRVPDNAGTVDDEDCRDRYAAAFRSVVYAVGPYRVTLGVAEHQERDGVVVPI